MAATLKKYLRVTFQCGPALKRKLELRARAENRTISNMIVTILTNALKGGKENTHEK